MKNSILISAAAGVVAATLLTAAADAQLIHRYSFNDGTATDSVGGANGTLVGGATISGGALNTVADGGFLSLPANVADGVTGSFTIEDFVTVSSVDQGFSSLFSLSSNPENFLLANPARPAASNAVTANFRQDGEGEFVVFNADATSPRDVQFLYTLVYDASVNGGTARLFINGTQVAEGTGGTITDFNLSQSSGDLNGIGRPVFSDPVVVAATDEFRIYANALSDAQVLANFQAGPNVIPEPATLGLLGVGSLGLLARRRRPA